MDSHDEDEKYGDRHRRASVERRQTPHMVNWQAIGIILAGVINFGATVWLIATLSASVSTLKSAVDETKGTMSALSQQSINVLVRLGVLESKVNIISDQTRESAR